MKIKQETNSAKIVYVRLQMGSEKLLGLDKVIPIA